MSQVATLSAAPEVLYADCTPAPEDGLSRAKPRLGFLGVGWIGRHRMEAIAASTCATVAAVADPSTEMLEQARSAAPEARSCSSLDELLQMDLDGIVIATPSALHAEQSMKALQRGMAVFCQKPLGRSGEEAKEVIDAARAADRLLGVDLSYRHITGLQRIKRLCELGELGQLYAADLVFHNAYGPDKPWFYDRNQAGGGCVMDLGIHLVDLVLWMLDFPRIANVTSRLYAHGNPISSKAGPVEDYCEARLDIENGCSVRIACSWNLPAGRDAVISGCFYGTKAGAGFSNVNGSFYDFTADRFDGTRREPLMSGPEPWDGRAAVSWTKKLAAGGKFDPESAHLTRVAEALDRIYQGNITDSDRSK